MAPMWSLPLHPAVALLALVALAAALPAAYAEILVLGELRAGEGQDWLEDAAAFESNDGHAYLLAVARSGTAQIINMTDPHNPALAASIRIGPDDSWFRDVEVFRPPDGRVYAVVAGDDTSILDLTDPTGPALVDVMRDGSGIASALDSAWDIEILERPDGRVHALVAGGDGRLRTVDVTDPTHLSTLGDPPSLGPGLPVSVGATFSGSGDGRIYALYTSHWVGVLVMDVTDPMRPVWVSAVRYDDWRSDYPFDVFGIPPPSSSDVLISDEYAAGLSHPGEVAVFRSPDGRTYAMVANNGFTSNVNDSARRSTPTGMLFLDVTDPGSPVPVGAVRNGEDGFDFGSHIRDIAVLYSTGGRVHAVVATGQDAVILDVTDPARPVTAARIQDGEGGFDALNLVFGMAVVGPPGGRTHLAMAGDEGIQVVDVTDPLAPIPAGSIPAEQAGLVDPAVFESGDGRTYALGVAGDGIHVVDVTDPARPVTAARIQDGEGGFDTLDEARQVEVFHTLGGRTYGMAGGDDGLQVVDVTDPAALVAVGSLRDGEGGFDVGWIIDMAAFQPPGGRDYVLVADHNMGIHVVDVTDPDAPALAAGLRGGEDGFELLGGAHGIAVFDAGGRPYALMTGDSGIHTIDMSRPGEPRVAGTLKGGVEGYPQLTAYDAVVFEASGGPYALVADYTAGLLVIDLTNPHEPAHVGSIPVGAEGDLLLVPGSPISTVASPDGRTYALAAGMASVLVADVTDPRAPALVDMLDLESYPWYVTVFGRDGGRAHALAGDADRMLVLDVTYPHASVPAGAVTEGYAARGGTVYAPEGGRALALVGSGYHTILVADLTDPRAPAVLGVIPAENDRPGDVVAAGSPDGRAYVMWIGASGGILAADITEPRAVAAPLMSDDMGLAPGSAMELFRPHDGRTYMLAGSGDTIRIIDVTYPSGLAYVGSIRDNLGGFYHLGDVRDISVVYGDGRVLALAGSGDGVQLIDVADPYHPAPAGGLDMDGVHSTAALHSDGRVLALAGGDGRTVILDVTRSGPPVPVGAIPISGAGPPTDVSVFKDSGGRLHALLAGEGGVQIVDITDPGAPVQIAALEGFAASDVSVFKDSGGRLHALLAGEGGVQIIYLDDPARYYAGTTP